MEFMYNGLSPWNVELFNSRFAFRYSLMLSVPPLLFCATSFSSDAPTFSPNRFCDLAAVAFHSTGADTMECDRLQFCARMVAE